MFFCAISSYFRAFFLYSGCCSILSGFLWFAFAPEQRCNFLSAYSRDTLSHLLNAPWHMYMHVHIHIYNYICQQVYGSVRSQTVCIKRNSVRRVRFGLQVWEVRFARFAWYAQFGSHGSISQIIAQASHGSQGLVSLIIQQASHGSVPTARFSRFVSHGSACRGRFPPSLARFRSHGYVHTVRFARFGFTIIFYSFAGASNKSSNRNIPFMSSVLRI